MTSMRRELAVSLLAAFVSVGITVRAATPVPRALFALRAQTPRAGTQIEVLVIQGSHGPGGIGAGLETLAQLREPPFAFYTHLTLVSRVTRPLGAVPVTVSIPGGSHAELTSTGRGSNGRYVVNVALTLDGRAHDVSFAAAPGDPFFTAHTTGADSALILGFIVH